MQGKLILYPPDSPEPKITPQNYTPTLDELQSAVGGCIEIVPGLTAIELDGELFDCVAFCNEYGKIENLPINQIATAIWYENLAAHGTSTMDVLCGPVVIVTGDEDFMEEL